MNRAPRRSVLVLFVGVLGTASCFEELQLAEVDAATEATDAAGMLGDGPPSGGDALQPDGLALVTDAPLASADAPAAGSDASPALDGNAKDMPSPGDGPATSDGSSCVANRPCKPANPCHAGIVSCAGGAESCVDMGLASDNTPCGSGMVCKTGSCVSSCAGDKCGSTCTSLQTDVANCGTCGHDCRALAHVAPGGAVSCSGGHCVIPANACAAGWGHCGGGPPDNGCETDISAVATCGCGSCTAGQVCNPSGGSYQCACAAATPNACPGKCVNLQSDGQNCGTCGHSCLGGTCSEGKCQPVQIYSQAAEVFSLAEDGAFIYFTREDSPGVTALARVGKDGSDPRSITSVHIGSFPNLVVANGVIYWAAEDQLRGCALPSCTGYGNRTPSQKKVRGVFASNSKARLFWSNRDEQLNVDQIMTNPASPTVVVNASPGDVPAADDQFVYYPNTNGGPPYRVPVGGGTPVAVGDASGSGGFVVNSTDSFFHDNGSNDPSIAAPSFVVYRLSLAQAGPSQHPQIVGYLPGLDYSLWGGIAADESHVYWFYGSGDGDLAVLRCPKGGCGANPTVLMRSDVYGTGTAGFTADSAAVYFATGKGIFKIAKP